MSNASTRIVLLQREKYKDINELIYGVTRGIALCESDLLVVGEF